MKLMTRLICELMRLRHGLVFAIKPPLGFLPFSSPGLWKRFLYQLQRLQWRFEAWLFERYCQSIRDEWKQNRGYTEKG